MSQKPNEMTKIVSVGVGEVGSRVIYCRIWVERSGSDSTASDVDAKSGWVLVVRTPVWACCGNEADGWDVAKL